MATETKENQKIKEARSRKCIYWGSTEKTARNRVKEEKVEEMKFIQTKQLVWY